MRAVIYTEYGPPEVLHLTEVEKPVPRDNEVLIRIHATTVTAADWRARSLSVPPGFRFLSRMFFGFSRPRKQILGTELAGVIESVGKAVTKFRVGDQVFAASGAGLGCYAEYRCMPEDATIALIPPNLSYEEAAAIPFGGTTALYFLRKGNLRRGERILINGASGGVGTAMVQLAKHFGAEVTGVCSTANVDLVKSLGATHVIDYTREDFTQNGQTYDIIADIAGTAGFPRSRNSLAERGRLLLVLGGMPDMLRIPWVAMTGRKRIVGGVTMERPEDLQFLAELTQTGSFRPVISRRYPLEQIVEAHRYADGGHKRGNVVITVARENPTR